MAQTRRDCNGCGSSRILDQAGRQFDPHVVAAFAMLDHPALLRRTGQGESRAEDQLPGCQARLSVHA